MVNYFPLDKIKEKNGRYFYRSGLRMTSPGARMPTNPMGHPVPGGPPPPPNAYRPGMAPAMSPSMPQPGPRMYVTSSPGVSSFNSFLLISHLISHLP